MRIPFITCLLTAAAVVVSAADGVSLTGKWQIQRSAAGNESQQDCTFTQKDSDLTGTCTSTDRGLCRSAGKWTERASPGPIRAIPPAVW
jgi:hypothetical protein